MKTPFLRALGSLPGVLLTGLLLFGWEEGGDVDREMPPASSSSGSGSEDVPGMSPEVDPEAVDALSEALAQPDPFETARSLGELLPRLSPAALPAVQDALGDPGRDLDPVEFDLLLRFWALHAPEDATRWTFVHAQPIYRMSATRAVVEAWAEADPAAALVGVEGALATLDKEVGQIAETALIRGWFQSDREGVESYVEGLGIGVKRQRAILAYALALAAADGSDAVIRWAEGIPEDDERYKLAVYRQLVSALSLVDMPAAVRFCDAHCDGPYSKGLRNLLARNRLRSGENGGEVIEWVGRSADETESQRQLKKRALSSAFGFWAFMDRESAVDWMRAQLAEEEADRLPWLPSLYGAYARQIAGTATEESIGWAERIEDENERERTLVRIVRYWMEQDEAAAGAWLEQSDLSDFAREQVRSSQAPLYLPSVDEEDEG